MKLIKYTIFLLIFLLVDLSAQDTLRIMSYNFLKYPDNASTRNPYLSKVIAEVDPDVIVCQEMKSLSGVNQVLNEVLSDKYKAGVFFDGNGSDTDNAIFYKDSAVEFIDHEQFLADPRKISIFRIKSRFVPDTLTIYGVHLKAGQGSSEESRRADSATRIRFLTKKLPSKSNFIAMGDFNIYKSTEAAFQIMLDTTDINYFIDPLDAVGTWNNRFSFRSIHTQSTRENSIGDGGSTGGMDDRFDIILTSESIIEDGGITLVNDSYTAFGNDSKHFNHSINIQPNESVSPEIADALYYSSDHLPVYADFEFELPTAVENTNSSAPAEFYLHQNYPNPFNPSTTISFTLPEKQFVSLSVTDILGREVTRLFSDFAIAGTHNIEFNAVELPSGIYFYRLFTDAGIFSKKMMLIK